MRQINKDFFSSSFWIATIILVSLLIGFCYFIPRTLFKNFKDDINFATRTSLTATNPERIELAASLLGDKFPQNNDVKQLNLKIDELGSLFFDKGIDAIYILAEKEGLIYFLAESTLIDDPLYVAPGSLYQEAPFSVYQAFSEKESFFTDVYTDEYGTYFSEFSPIFNQGKVVAVLGVDVDYNYFKARLLKARILIVLSLFFLYFIALLILSFFRKTRKINQEIERNNKKVKAIIDAIPDGVISFNREERIIFWNHTCNKFFGFNSQTTTGKNIYEYLKFNKVYDSVTQKEIKDFKFYSDFNRSGERVELEINNKEGGSRFFEVSFNFFESGNEFLAIAIFRDISSRKNRQDELSEQKNQLEKLNAMMVDRELKMVELKAELARCKGVKPSK